ncbi:unnamed protein product [Lymnaea stagnalis]|uniref:Uncharacterized protein n=1 Tax=Lymnaea stagnalis TaxID=6523 RepID=A0AAV2HB07_LYMST
MTASVGSVLLYSDIRQLHDILNNGRIENGAIRRMLASGSAARIRIALCFTGNYVTEATKRDSLEKDECSTPHKDIDSVEGVMETAEMLHSLSAAQGEDVSRRGYFGNEAAATNLEPSVDLGASSAEPEMMDVKLDSFIIHDSQSDVRTPGPPNGRGVLGPPNDRGVSGPPNDRGVPGPPSDENAPGSPNDAIAPGPPNDRSVSGPPNDRSVPGPLNDRSVPESQTDLDVSGLYVRDPSWQLPERAPAVFASHAPTRIATVSERLNREDIENIRKDSDRHWTDDAVLSQSGYRLLGSDMILQVIRL